MFPNSARRDGDAIARFEGYLKIDPHNVPLRIDLGDLYHTAGRFDDARSCYEAALEDDPDNKILRGRLANVAISEHRFADAETLLRELEADGAADPALMHNLGLSLVYQKRFDEALTMFERAREGGLPGTQTQAYLTRTLHQMGDLGRAIEECGKWLEETGTDEVEGYLALLEGDAGFDPEAAYRRASAVLSRAPNNPDAAVVVGTRHLEKMEIDKALEIFNRLSERQPGNPRGWMGLALVAMMDRRPDDAIRLFNRTLEITPDDAATLVALGWAHMSKMDGFNAEGYFRRAIAADPKMAEAHGGLASSLVHQFQFDDAQREIRIARGLDKRCFGAGYATSIMLEMRGKHESAEKIFTAYMTARPREDALTGLEAAQIALARNQRIDDELGPPQPVRGQPD